MTAALPLIPVVDTRLGGALATARAAAVQMSDFAGYRAPHLFAAAGRCDGPGVLSPRSRRDGLNHLALAAAYALGGELDRAATELAEARKLRGEGSFSSIAMMKAGGLSGSLSPKTRTLLEATYFAGPRKAGMPEE
jgi:hypothetical protein